MVDHSNIGIETNELDVRDFTTEAAARFNPELVKQSQERLRSWSKEKLQALKQEGEAIAQEMAAIMHLGIESAEVQALIRRHHALIENYFHVTSDVYQGLGELYELDSEFAAFYEKYAIGLSQFIRRAIALYCNTEFKEIGHFKQG